MSTSAGHSWNDCDQDIQLFIETFVTKVANFMDDNLVGVYLHGSLTMGSYYRPKSDIDIFIVVDNPLSVATATNLNIMIAHHSATRPTTSTFELNVITAEVAKHPRLPLPYELHYSIGWHDKILSGAMDYTTKHTDVDLVAQLAYAQQYGICLFGKPISDAIGTVAWSDVMASVRADYTQIITGENILSMPINNVLNICRVIQLQQQPDETLHNKDDGAAWGMAHLPAEYRPLIQKALQTYHSDQPVTREKRKTGGIKWDRDELLAFRDYARTLPNDSTAS